ncbi:cytochrome c [Vreelandella malpeensis]|uniref:Cytochrome c n=1 Tax=Vreelandella malpeensis TaxID=1172368 RepID=A0ABS8DR50_9GAMM|nr:cytochrome c [Halomonas malpeensis]MCB8888797.1 cytochrome c [Halomonas malpeensis]
MVKPLYENPWYKALVLTLAPWIAGAALAQADTPSRELIQRGEAVSIAGDCAACHSEPGRPAYSGGHPIKSPLGTIYSTNITPSTDAGIGDYSLEQFSDALRRGVRADGRQLYPAMPYTAYAKMTDEDIEALYAYFMHGVEPASEAPPETELPFPFNLRFSMKAWNLLFLDSDPFEPDPERSEQWNRGAYLVQGATHCGTCHTPRNALMAEKSSQALAGGSLGTWYAPDITDDPETGIGGWSRRELVDYLRTGHSGNGATAAGPMLEAIDLSFSRMPEEDIEAIAVYLLPEAESEAPAEPASAERDAQTNIGQLIDDDTPAALDDITPGERVYRDQCAACHAPGGQGLNGLPALAGHPVLDKPNADNVAMAILEGVWPEHRQGMLGFADELGDQQIADVTNHLMSEFGQSDVRIDTARVAELRAGGAPSSLLMLARVGMGVAGIVVVVLLGVWLSRRRRRRTR